MSTQPRFLARPQLNDLLAHLSSSGYQVIGPQVRDNGIVYAPLERADQLPQGIHDLQAPGSYRLESGDSPRYFAWANGPQALKPLTFPGREALWENSRSSEGRQVFAELIPEMPPTAVLGVRACDLAALLIHDQHFIHGDYLDPYFLARRKNLLLIAVHCTHPAATCFCAATDDGPRARYGFDIGLTELDEGFIIEPHTERGTDIIQQLDTREASSDELDTARISLEQAAQQQRRLPTEHIAQRLLAALDHPHWEALGERCLACGNCTAVCPTCFCQNTVTDVSPDGQCTTQHREWESCFSQQHSYIHGISIRPERPQRYRQWLTHKFGSWVEQFGRSGCVGCGRCITWCPVGIDVTAELAVLCGEPAHD